MPKRKYTKLKWKKLKSYVNYFIKYNRKYVIQILTEDGCIYKGKTKDNLFDELKDYLEYEVIDYNITYKNKKSYYVINIKEPSKIYAKELTKDFLLRVGFKDAYMDENNEWHITRQWDHTLYGDSEYELGIISATAHHPYGKDVTYNYIKFNYKGISYGIQLGRFLYVWFIGDIEPGYVIDHINDNPLDNRIENLQKLTIKENINKRQGQCFNQYLNSNG